MYRQHFPLFTAQKDLVFLDSASSAQKPEIVIQSMTDFFSHQYANIHRGAYDLSMESSLLYDRAKKAIKERLYADSESEIVFTYNATYACNLISRSLIKTGLLKKGDTILLSKLDHHANIVPWQIISEEYGINIDWIGLNPDGTLDYVNLENKLKGVTLVSLTGASNVTGEVLDLEKLSSLLGQCEKRPLCVIDGSQRFPHMETDVKKYGIDIFFATGHKVMSDTGIGFFYARKDLLKMMIPALCGGGAINAVTTRGYEPAGLPFRHEPGTPHIAGAVSLLAALNYIDSIGGFKAIESYEKDLTEYALSQFEGLPAGIHLLGSKSYHNRLGVFSFSFDTKHPHDVAEVLADNGICVRSGHHCTEPFHEAMGIGASLRASLYIYNTRQDIDRFVEVLREQF
ncbi:aminotransferase class V-fold PLP-dependent enzyme [Candidatus Gracilibacteria bacterium]|nr:aminotransferase class V-fold PLP-dependent enzyme [Candidatus Gracilibacteria bacterium]